MSIHRIKTFIFLLPIALFLIFLCIKLLFVDVYTSLIQEDSVVENMQAVFYLLSSIISFLVSITCLRSKMPVHGILCGLLAIGLMFTSLEEVSWTQRIFDIANPAYYELNNLQHEISLHNLNVVQPKLHRIYILVGAYGAFAWIFASLFLSRARANYRHIVNFVLPEWFMSSYFFFTFFIYALLEYVSRPYLGGFLVWRDQEPVELLLSLGFFSLVVTNYVRLQRCLGSASSGRAKKARR